MRMRKKPNLSARMDRCRDLLIPDPAALRGRWRSLKPGAADVRLELGCGKGRFTAEEAAACPDSLYLALERVPDAMIIAMERCRDRGLTNVFFLDADAADLRSFFAPDEVDILYINFPDPWPGKKHARRRLTEERFLVLYRGFLRTGGEIRFKTDNADLFSWSLEQFPAAGYRPEQVTRDLHAGGIRGVLTDYEEKFCQQGLPIHRCVAVREPLDPEPEFVPIGRPDRERREQRLAAQAASGAQQPARKAEATQTTERSTDHDPHGTDQPGPAPGL